MEAAQEAAQAEDEEAELARATAAVARLTAPARLSEANVAAAEKVVESATEGGRRPPSQPKVGKLHHLCQAVSV